MVAESSHTCPSFPQMLLDVIEALLSLPLDRMRGSIAFAFCFSSLPARWGERGVQIDTNLCLLYLRGRYFMNREKLWQIRAILFPFSCEARNPHSELNWGTPRLAGWQGPPYSRIHTHTRTHTLTGGFDQGLSSAPAEEKLLSTWVRIAMNDASPIRSQQVVRPDSHFCDQSAGLSANNAMQIFPIFAHPSYYISIPFPFVQFV